MKKAEDAKKKLVYNRKMFWQDTTKEEQKVAFKFADEYKNFLSTCKTEREAIAYFVQQLEKRGFKDIDKKGSEKSRFVYRIFKNKALAIAVLGKDPVSKGLNIIGSHIDSPRVDLKQNPLYEDGTTKLGIMRTHYYGGIKKYQWMSTPLSLHGVVVKTDGTTVNVNIGEADNDPVFIMPDLLPHLARKEQMGKTMAEGVSAGNMNVIFNTIPFAPENSDIKEAVKLQALQLLYDKYKITEEDLLSAELQLAPAGKARDAGIDRSMVVGFGQDDRICAFTSVMALFDIKEMNCKTNCVAYLFDKEESGSMSVGGAHSIFFEDFVADLLKHKKEDYTSLNLRKTFINTRVISADVSAALNPNFPSVHEVQNAILMGYGVGIAKYLGSGGKSGSNDATSEFMSRLLKIFNEEKVNWQVAALGKVDEGGGGTISWILAQYGCDVIDIGPGLFGMHSLHEMVSKADLYSAYKAYRAFYAKA